MYRTRNTHHISGRSKFIGFRRIAAFSLAIIGALHSSGLFAEVVICSSQFGADYDCGGNPRTPEAKAAYIAKEQERKAASAAEDAKKAARQQKIDDEVKKLGSHRVAEATRLVDMRERAEAARQKYVMPEALPRDCKKEWLTGTIDGYAKSDRTTALISLQDSAGRQCARLGGYSLSAERCEEQKRFEPVVENGSITRRQLPSKWVCHASFRCNEQQEICKVIPGKGTRQ